MHRTVRPYLRSGTAWAAVLVVSIGLLAASPLLRPGLPDTPLGPLHALQGWLLRTTAETPGLGPLHAASIVTGVGSDTLGGATDYLVAAGMLSGLAASDALRLAVGLALVVGAVGCYLLVRPYASTVAASLAGAAYVCAPLVLHTTYLQGAYGRLLAFSAAPYCLWGMLLLAERPSRLGFAAVALSAALVTAADPGVALAYTPVVLVAAAAVAVVATERRARVFVWLALFVGLLVAAPAWAPRQGMATAVAGAPIGLVDLLAIPQTADTRAANPQFPLGLGGHLVILAVPSLTLVGRGGRRAVAATVALAACLCYPALAGAEPALWPATVPAVAALGPAALGLAVLVGLSVDAWRDGSRRRAAWATAALLAVLLGAAPYLFPARPFVDWSALTRDQLLHCLTGVELTGGEAAACPVAAAVAEPLAAPLPGLSLRSLQGGALTFEADLATAGSVTLPFASAPGLAVAVDGQPAGPPSPSGQPMTISVPAGAHTFAVVQAGSPALDWPFYLGLVGWVVLILGAWALRGRCAPARLSDGDALLPAALALGAIALLVAKVLYVEPYTMLFRIASEPGVAAAAAHDTAAAFRGGPTLIGYTLQRNLPPQGEPVVVTLYWVAQEPLPADVGVTVSLLAPSSGQVMAQSSHARPGGLPARRWQPGAYVIDEHEIALPAGFPAVSYDLSVAVTDQRTGQALATEAGEPCASLGTVQVLYHLPIDVKRFPGDAWYRFGESIRLLGCDLGRASAGPGDDLAVTLFWRTEAPVHNSMRRFVDLVDADGSIVAQADSWAVDGLYPTDRWLPLHNIADRVYLRVPLSAAPGEYRLVVGLHDATTLTRPAVFRRDGAAVAAGAVTLPGHVLIR